MTECSLERISIQQFHNLTSYCNDSSVSSILIFPSTFFIQLIRFTLSLCAIIILLALYNFIKVMSRHLLNTATCSLYWIAMCAMITLKSAVVMIFPILAVEVKSAEWTSQFNRAGFILQAVLQSGVTLLLFVALDHERQFRSIDFATIESQSKRCVAMSCRLNLLCSWFRLGALVLSVVPLVLLLVIEIMHHKDDKIDFVLVCLYIVSLPLARLACVAMGVVLLCKRGTKLSPAVLAKVYLVLGLVFSIMEDFPNFVTACDNQKECSPFNRLTVFDLLQLLGIGSLVFFVMFVRSQYLRVEQESKLNLLGDLQKLLQVNGRGDSKRYT